MPSRPQALFQKRFYHMVRYPNRLLKGHLSLTTKMTLHLIVRVEPWQAWLSKYILRLRWNGKPFTKSRIYMHKVWQTAYYSSSCFSLVWKYDELMWHCVINVDVNNVNMLFFRGKHRRMYLPLHCCPDKCLHGLFCFAVTADWFTTKLRHKLT